MQSQHTGTVLYLQSKNYECELQGLSISLARRAVIAEKLASQKSMSENTQSHCLSLVPIHRKI